MNARPITRDYKRRPRRSLDLRHWREFVLGLAAGLAVAAAIFLLRSPERELVTQRVARPEPRADKSPANAGATDGLESATQFEFYERLPKFEVVVPEKDQDVKRDLPSTPVERPGVYVLQAGSYRSVDDAERVRVQLEVLGVSAAVQRVAVDNDVWHRVRVGPLGDLAEVNRLRDKLRTADIDVIVIRVGD